MSTGGKSNKRSGSSKKTARKRSSAKAIDRPFAKIVLAKAERIASGYRLIIEPSEEVGYFGRTAELPYVMADGDTIEACLAATIDATIFAIAALLEQEQRPPAPASAGTRDQQVNIRLSVDEKQLIGEAAERAGVRSLSDFIRRAALRDSA